MIITDLSEPYYRAYFHCLEEWSKEMDESGDSKETWFNKMKHLGLRVKIAIDEKDDRACGMIQYIPIEESFIDGNNCYFIKCIWVHGYKQGIGNYQKQGIGTALLRAAEEDVRAMRQQGIAAWGISMPFWMKASWFKKHGFKKVDNHKGALLMWKPFVEDAIPPQWIRPKKTPELVAGKVAVSAFVNGWCPAQNIVYERAKQASLEFRDHVVFQEYRTLDKDIFTEWGIADAIYIDDKQINTGPPPSFEKIKKMIERKVKKVARL